ncbi:Hypothetical_protein [Hexamita inflata]|uniref:Hypothetical_protein n=1 Tax=Hexamita inflata TaxID=28002 RepID=A0AA86TG19_9EUKA|nr:Hypothetical protein HINF_LOCUS3946 [Hexamita inflata]
MKSPWTRTITLQKTNYQYNDIIREINVVKQQLGQKSTKIEKQQQMSIEQLENQLQKHINESKVLQQTLIDSDNNMQILYEENYNYQQEISKLKTENQQLFNESQHNKNQLDQLQQKYEDALSSVDRFKLLIEQMQDDLEVSCVNASNFINNIQFDNETTYDLINLVYKYHQILNSYEMIPKSDVNTIHQDLNINFQAQAQGVINELVSHQKYSFKQNMNNISQRMQQDLDTFTQTLENQCQQITYELNSMDIYDETQKDLIKLVTQCYLELNLRSQQLESQLQLNQQLKQQLNSLQQYQIQNQEQTIENAPEIQQIQNGNTIEMKTINEQQSLPQLFTLYQKPLMNDKQTQTNLIQNQESQSIKYQSQDSKCNECQQCIQYEEELDQLELEIVDKNQQILALLNEIQNIYTEKQNIADKLDYSYIYFNEYADNKNAILSRHDDQQSQYNQKSNSNKYYEQSTLKDKLINTKQYFDRQFSELKLKGSINEHHNNNTSILPETQVLQSNTNIQTLEEQITKLKKQQFEDFNYMNVLTLNYKKMESEYQQKIQVQNQIIQNLSIK